MLLTGVHYKVIQIAAEAFEVFSRNSGYGFN